MEDIKIIDFLCGKCQYKGCWHNDSNGVCINDDKEFLLNIFDKVRDMYENNDFGNLLFHLSVLTFECEPSLYDNTCKYCGAQLRYHVDRVPYGDTYTSVESWYCPNCD